MFSVYCESVDYVSEGSEGREGLLGVSKERTDVEPLPFVLRVIFAALCSCLCLCIFLHRFSNLRRDNLFIIFFVLFMNLKSFAPFGYLT